MLSMKALPLLGSASSSEDELAPFAMDSGVSSDAERTIPESHLLSPLIKTPPL